MSGQIRAYLVTEISQVSVEAMRVKLQVSFAMIAKIIRGRESWKTAWMRAGRSVRRSMLEGVVG